MNKLSTEIDSIISFVGEEKAIQMVKIAGFDCYNFDLCHICDFDFQNDKAKKINHPLAKHSYKNYLLNIKNISEKIGIFCNQTHAPFPIHNKQILKAQKKAVVATNLLGAKIMVMHPDGFKSVDENVKFFKKIAKFAKKYNVKIAVENIFNWSGTHAIFSAGSTPESLLDLINKIGEDNVGVCLDIGHAEIMGELANATDFIYKLKDKIIATHIHDNDLKNDRHQIPFSNSIDFVSICKAFKEINYQGELTLESIYYYKKDPNNGQEMVNNLYKAISKINEMVNR